MRQACAYRIDWCVPIPMRDGIILNATIYRPLPDDRSRCVVLTVTPYMSDTYHERGKAFAERGFVFAIVDTRGRGSSGGAFAPMLDGRADGYDLVEWLGTAAFCDGSVVMWGGSYAGMNQWLAATQRPLHLKAIAPAASALMGYDMPFHGGIYITWNIQWLTLTSGKGVQFNANADAAYWHALFTRFYLAQRPFIELDAAAGNTSTVWPHWAAHQHLDGYWDAHNPLPDELASLDLPILTITGLYDDSCVSSLELFRRHLQAATPAASSRHEVLIGPWDHSGTRAPRRHVGDLVFGPQSTIDLNALHAQWYAWATQGSARPAFLRDRITYYVSGSEEWRHAPTLEAITTGERRFTLRPGRGGSADAFASGLIVETTEETTETAADVAEGGLNPSTFTYDPLDTRPAAVITPVDINRPMTLSDQTFALNLFGNGLVYHTPPIAEPFMLAGMPVIDLWISMDVPDTDLKVALYEIMPNGKSLILGEDMLRARFRRSLREPELVTPGAIERYRFERLTWNSRLIGRYSRIRLVVSSPNSIFEQKNYNSGGDVMRETAADARTARITVHHAAPYASTIYLPLGDIISGHRLSDTDVTPYLTPTASNAQQG